MTSYGGINAKVKAMKGRLLDCDDYYLLSQCQTVDDVGHKLGEYPAYGGVMAGYEGEIRRAFIESKILLSLAMDFSRIYSFISDYDLKNYLDAVFLRNEVDIIKLLLCAVYDERNIAYTLPELTTLLGKKMRIDINRLVNAKTLDEFISHLQGTVFYKALSQKYQEDSPSLFELEMSLDLYYYLHLWKLQTLHLDKRNKKVMAMVTGTEIDLRNIQWAYRLKTFYNMSPSRIYTYLIPIHYRLSREMLEKIVESRSGGELRAEIENTPYGRDFSWEQPIERSITLAMNRVHKRAEMAYPNSLATTTAFIYFKELEIKNIVSLLEGVRYGLKQDEIMSYLVMDGNAVSSVNGG